MQDVKEGIMLSAARSYNLCMFNLRAINSVQSITINNTAIFVN